jgi:hypothetical protein
MSFQTQLTYDIPLLRRAVFAYWRRSIGLVLPAAFAFLVADLVFLLASGDTSWIVGVFATVIFLTGVFFAALYVIHYRNALQKLRDMGAPHARFRADEPTFTVESKIGHSTFRWSSIREVWRFPTFWLLLFSKAQFMTLPLSCVSTEMQVFILRRIQAMGGKIS